MKPVVVVAGAAGFVGVALTRRLTERFTVIGTSRRELPPIDEHGVHWRRADMYSLLQAEHALEGARYAIYLVHSMMPSARLTQARFEDLDLILADNFGRAAALADVEQIVYLGGILPDGEKRSRHLESRREVEDALGAHGVAVTALRAGLVVGPGGSSLDILTALVRRLPLMLTPKWTETKTQPVALDDLLRAFEHAIGNEKYYAQHVDIGGPDILTYREMMRRTAEALDVKRFMFSVPFLTPRLSAAWVTMVTGAPRQLVGPLVESLEHTMVADDSRLFDEIGGAKVSFDEAVQRALTKAAPAPTGAGSLSVRTARSIQRLPLPRGWNAMEVAELYATWLPKFFRPFLRVDRTQGDVLHFRTIFWPKPLLELTYAPKRSFTDRALFYITGGFLSKRDEFDGAQGRLEFRIVNGGKQVIAAVHDFRPSLPWLVYSSTQAIVHLIVMKAFGRHLKKIASMQPVSLPDGVD